MVIAKYSRPHHQRIASLLGTMDVDFLKASQCYFGGGTAIALQLNEYRESTDVDFLCSSREGYRMLRELVYDKGIQGLFTKPVQVAREARADQYGVRAICLVNGVNIKFEIVSESRIVLSGAKIVGIPVPCLSRVDLFTEKLLANTDRGADRTVFLPFRTKKRSVMNRDIIDLLAMKSCWGRIPSEAWASAELAYGKSVVVAWQRSFDALAGDTRYLNACLSNMSVDGIMGEKIKQAIKFYAQQSAPSLDANVCAGSPDLQGAGSPDLQGAGSPDLQGAGSPDLQGNETPTPCE